MLIPPRINKFFCIVGNYWKFQFTKYHMFHWNKYGKSKSNSYRFLKTAISDPSNILKMVFLLSRLLTPVFKPGIVRPKYRSISLTPVHLGSGDRFGLVGPSMVQITQFGRQESKLRANIQGWFNLTLLARYHHVVYDFSSIVNDRE